jgi:ribosome recycling factor
MSAEDVALTLELAEDSMKKAISHLEAELTNKSWESKSSDA